MDQVKYICTGGCNGEVTDEEYKEGKTSCGTTSCSKFGQPFEKRVWNDAHGHYEPEGGH